MKSELPETNVNNDATGDATNTIPDPANTGVITAKLLRSLIRREVTRALTRFARTQPGTRTFAPTDGDMFSIAEAARKLRRAEFTVREWCRLGRVHAQRMLNGKEWRISRKEIMRVQAEGLLPIDASRNNLED